VRDEAGIEWGEPEFEVRDGRPVWSITCRFGTDGVSVESAFVSQNWERPVTTKVTLRVEAPTGRSVTHETLDYATSFVRLETITGQVMDQGDHWLDQHPQMLDGEPVTKMFGRQRGGRPAIPIEQLVDVAIAFLRAFEGDPRRPYRQLQNDVWEGIAPMSLQGMSTSWLRQLVRRCEDEQLLTRPGQGGRKRLPTPRLERWRQELGS
jgi:hypothetical protein